MARAQKIWAQSKKKEDRLVQRRDRKVSSVLQVRKFLIKIKKVNRKDQKNTTETNVVEEWNELYLNGLG